MRVYSVILSFLLLFFSCKSGKTYSEAENITEKLSARKVLKKHRAANFKNKTVDAKLKVIYRDKKNNHSFSLKLKIKKDEVIWLKGTKFITVFKAKITPTEVSYYSALNKTYFTGDFSVLEKLLGVKINFTQLQNILLGQAVFDIKNQQYSSVIDGNSHLLEPKRQKALFHLFLWVNSQHYKLDRQSLKSKSKNKTLDIFYEDYAKIYGVVFPKIIKIRAKEKQKFTDVELDYKSVQFNTVLDLLYKIPTGYKQVIFK